MKYEMFSVYDDKALYYGRPICSRSTPEAMRSFASVARDPETSVFKTPGDFHLYKVGIFDDSSGLVEVLTPVFICRASELLACPPVPQEVTSDG